MSKYIFLSYARLDRDEDRFGCVRRFYDDLVQEIRHKTAKSKDDICYFDGQDSEPGFDWPATLSEALSTCRIFVSLYSCTYFTREHCGKEWEIFHSRLLDHARKSETGTEVPPLIFPVLLGAPDELAPLSDRIARIQYQHDDFPKVYNQYGLRYMIRLRLKSEYALFITELARKIIDTAENHVLSPLDHFPDISNVRSAFVEQEAQGSSDNRETQEVDPRRVDFFFVAGKRQELQAVKDQVKCYGHEGGSDWKPYLPACNEEVALIAQGVAYNEKLISEIIALDENMIRRLKEAKENKRIVALIVDAWTVQLKKYAGWMRAYDEYDAYNCAMLISFNIEDEETRNKLEMLNLNICELFETKTTRTDGLFSYPINSPEKLREKLAFVLGKIRMNILSKKIGDQEASPDPTISMPTISGPGGV